MKWNTWTVRYWSHDNGYPGKWLNDCFGNSTIWTGKARTNDEAIKRAEKFVLQFGIHFRLHSVVMKIT